MRRERALKIVLVVVGLLFTAGVVPLTMLFSRALGAHVNEHLCHTRNFLAAGGARPSGEPQSNRLRRMGKSCACWGNGSAGILECDRAPRTRGSACFRNRRCFARRTGSGEALARTGIGG